MIDPSDMEIAAMQSCLGPLGEYVGSIGMQRPLADYSRDEVLMLIDVVVTRYQDSMLAEHERMSVPFGISITDRVCIGVCQTATERRLFVGRMGGDVDSASSALAPIGAVTSLRLY